MSRQVDKKIEDLDKKFAKVLEITGKEQGEFAMECAIQPATLAKALERSSFSKDIVNKIYDKFRIRKAYWMDGKEPIIDGNNASVELLSKKKDPDEQIRILTLNLNRMGEMNEYLLKRVRDLEQGTSH